MGLVLAKLWSFFGTEGKTQKKLKTRISFHFHDLKKICYIMLSAKLVYYHNYCVAWE